MDNQHRISTQTINTVTFEDPRATPSTEGLTQHSTLRLIVYIDCIHVKVRDAARLSDWPLRTAQNSRQCLPLIIFESMPQGSMTVLPNPLAEEPPETEVTSCFGWPFLACGTSSTRAIRPSAARTCPFGHDHAHHQAELPVAVGLITKTKQGALRPALTPFGAWYRGSVALRLPALRLARLRRFWRRCAPVGFAAIVVHGGLPSRAEFFAWFHSSSSQVCCAGFRGIKPFVYERQSATPSRASHSLSIPRSRTSPALQSRAARVSPRPSLWSNFISPLRRRTQRGDGNLTHQRSSTMKTANQTTSTLGSKSCNAIGRSALPARTRPSCAARRRPCRFKPASRCAFMANRQEPMVPATAAKTTKNEGK